MVRLSRFLPQSLAARTLAALTLVFAVLFAAMVGVHDVLLRQAVERATHEFLSQRLAILVDAVAAVPEGDREDVARALSRTGLTVRWHRDPPAAPGRSGPAEWRKVGERTIALARSAAEARVQPGRQDPATADLSVEATAKLTDGSWLDVQLASFEVLSADQGMQHAYAAIVGLLLLLAVGFAARSVAKPVSSLAAAVTRLDPAQDAPALPASGPLEVRQLAEALNGMAARTRDAFRQRTLALGALSHDLMSPIARLRLRAEDLPEDAREPIRRDLAEMETMVSDVLAYLRGGNDGEPARPLDVAALVRTVADEFTDAGTPIEERRMDRDAVVTGRRVAIKRAVTNLVGNAVRHGRDPWVEVEVLQGAVLVRVGDHGPGIPSEDLPRVTEPFFRGDRARTVGGGIGLGLSTARAITEAHEGNLEIESIGGQGTIVTLRLPTAGEVHPAGAPGKRSLLSHGERTAPANR